MQRDNIRSVENMIMYETNLCLGSMYIINYILTKKCRPCPIATVSVNSFVHISNFYYNIILLLLYYDINFNFFFFYYKENYNRLI